MAPVASVDITSREAYADGQPFGDTGPYERIDGVVTFTADPENAANSSITDIGLAGRDDDGLVRFSSDFTLITPTAPGSGKLLVDVVNRGRKVAVNTFNRVPPSAPSREQPPGDGFLFRHGFSVLSIGWQWDVFREEALLGLQAPPVLVDGRPATGQAVVEIRPNFPTRETLLANRLHQPYPAVDTDGAGARLLVRDWEDGPETEVPRNEFRFARESNGDIVPSDEHVYLSTGFQPGKIYRIVYQAGGCVLVGAGLLAVREAAVLLRHPSALNPVATGFEHAYAYGVSQTGRMLRHFLYLGLNLDESGRRVYDGLLPHVAGGRRGEFNHRFAQPSQQSEPGFGHVFPFADEPASDAFSSKSDGLLSRQRALGDMPKVVYTNSSAEYWRGDGSMQHIDPNGLSDAPQAPETRSYHFSGTQHGAGSLDRAAAGPDGSLARHPFNVVDYRPLLRASLINLHRWAADSVEPPPSKHPRLDDGTAVTKAGALRSMPAIPGLVQPDIERLWVLRDVDLGPDAAAGIGSYPAKEGGTYPSLASALDADGNETAGIRLPDLDAPVGTHTGWNPRDPETGAPEQLIPMQGFTLFFPPTKNAREAAGDDRLSLEERYVSKDDYLKQVRELAIKLAGSNYLLPEDIDLVVESCAARYDAAAGHG